jgi:hypothetical protein
MAYGAQCGMCGSMGDSGLAPLDGLGDTVIDNPYLGQDPTTTVDYGPTMDQLTVPVDQGPTYNPGVSSVPPGTPWYQDVLTGAIQAGTKVAQQVLAPVYTPGYTGPYMPGYPTTAPIYQRGMPSLMPSVWSPQSSYLPWVVGAVALGFLFLKKKRG